MRLAKQTQQPEQDDLPAYTPAFQEEPDDTPVYEAVYEYDPDGPPPSAPSPMVEARRVWAEFLPDSSVQTAHKLASITAGYDMLDIQVREGSGPWEEYSSDMMSDAEHDDLRLLRQSGPVSLEILERSLGAN